MNQTTSASPSCNSTTTPTGRPPMWSASAQRKMARLYVYTTLPLETIVRLIYSRSPEATPGIDSANKKLNGLLDKEPRWLHPRTESDMGRRVAQLSKSTVRLASASNPPLDLSSSTSNDTPHLSPSSDGDIKRETGGSPAQREGLFLDTSSPVAHGQGGDAQSLKSPVLWPMGNTSPQLENHVASHGELAGAFGDEDGVFSPFLRKTSFSSVSTDCSSNGSFCEILQGYSRPYIETVKRLVKRFTAPTGNRPDLSPCLNDVEASARKWAEKGPLAFRREPFPLAGDLLHLDVWIQNQQCKALVETHERRQCLCYAQFDGFVSPWVGAQGLTALGHRILAMGPLPADMDEMDSSGNTVLHLLAARSSIRLLVQVLRSAMLDTILHAKNTARQTFVHVLNRSEMGHADSVCELLHVAADKGLDLYALDVYGRSVFHLLHLSELGPGHVSHLCHVFDGPRLSRRDAFGLVPKGRGRGRAGGDEAEHEAIEADGAPCAGEGSSPMALESDPGIAREARLLEHIRLAQVHPQLEDALGGNGLHALAAATLSSGSMTQNGSMASSSSSSVASPMAATASASIGASISANISANISPSVRATGPPMVDKLLDSSSARLEFRLGLATGLLDAGLPEENDYKTGPRILGLLVTRGADVHARNRAGETALHVAHGASVYARDAAGQSVLDVADDSKGLAEQQPTVLDEWGLR
ncbi:hypothetical protein CDD81_3821 [Ophiocordyceps australis]|uniref:Uncharacterized protein n=1 Tax=Ophiocordyceps australis TaxID=1399860 RepID=A0A2C5XVF4_9HYPO|nr:hypothetical protein CDD81_3821 [Ophiocordyceps australis]